MPARPLMDACTILAAEMLFPAITESLTTQLLAHAPSERSGQLSRMDRLCGLALCAADRVLLTGPAVGRLSPLTTAVVLGTAQGCHKTDEEYYRGVLGGEPSPRLFAYTLPSSPIGEVSIQHGLLGPSLCIVSGRTAGLEALGEAQLLLSLGDASACLVLACEVAAPAVFENSKDAALCDAAVAVLLTGSATALPECGNQILSTALAYRPGDSAAALRVALDELQISAAAQRDIPLLCDVQTQAFVASGLGTVRVLKTANAGAATPLATLATAAAADDLFDFVVLAADAAGQAAAARCQRIRSATSRTAPLPPGRLVT